MALSLVLVSGGLFGAQADCGLCSFHFTSPCSWNLNPCGWHFPSLCNACGSRDTDKKDLDKPAVSDQQKMDKGTY
jgi:hypothetical protein